MRVSHLLFHFPSFSHFLSPFYSCYPYSPFSFFLLQFTRGFIPPPLPFLIHLCGFNTLDAHVHITKRFSMNQQREINLPYTTKKRIILDHHFIVQRNTWCSSFFFIFQYISNPSLYFFLKSSLFLYVLFSGLTVFLRQYKY